MYDIIYFGNDWFAENKTSSHHIAERLARSNRILYVECPGLRAPKASGRDLKKIFSKVSKCFRKPQKISSNLSVYTLFQIPFHRFAVVRFLNRVLIVSVIKLLRKSLKFERPLLWFVVPHLCMVPDRVVNKAVVYYCIDDYAALPDIDINSVARMDKEMTESADIVFVASETLLEKKKALNENVNVSPHGVDFDHFNKVYTGEISKIPEDVAYLKKSIVVGFFGLIEEWIDLDLVRYVALKHPEWHILMIGRVAVSNNVCDDLSNVHFIGRRPFGLLPDYATVFDVTILPYKLNAQVINSNPIKLREYLATSLPVVSVNFPQVNHYCDVVEIADNYDEFVEGIENSLTNDTDEKREARVASVKSSTWEARVSEIIRVVDKFCSKE